MAEQLTDDQKKIKDLEGQVATLTQTNADQLSQLGTLKTDLTNAQSTVKDLDKQLGVALAAKAQAEADSEQALQIVKDLKAQLAAKEATGDKLPTVTVGKDTYELTSEFTFGGREINYQVLTEEPALAQQLVKEGVSNLRKVTGK